MVRFRKGAPRSWKFFASVSGGHVAWKVPLECPPPLSRGAYFRRHKWTSAHLAAVGAARGQFLTRDGRLHPAY